MNKRKKIILCALLLASTIVLGRILSIRTTFLTIGFAFVPIMLSAIMLGPKYSIFIATISDILGTLLFPTGSYFIGFTITSFLAGLTYGILLYRKEFKIDKNFFNRLIISTLIVNLLFNGALNTIWLQIINKGASTIIVPIRVLKQLIMTPIQIITISSLCKILKERINNILHD